jgi:hypothetical protein
VKPPLPTLSACLRAGYRAGFVAAATLAAHEHIDIGPSTTNPGQLAAIGLAAETMTYVPPGEPFSTYAPRFRGAAYAAALTFSSEDPDGSLPRVQLLSVTGPAGGSFAFWEVNATTPTWSRPADWTSTESDRPSFVTYEDGTGYGHIHGRLFTATHPGEYTVVFRAVDDSAARTSSEPKTVVFTVLATPPLSIQVQSGVAALAFTSRPGLSYDLQVSTTLAANDWSTIGFASGTGGEITFSDPLADRPRVFYRLVEYF